MALYMIEEHLKEDIWPAFTGYMSYADAVLICNLEKYKQRLLRIVKYIDGRKTVIWQRGEPREPNLWKKEGF